MKPNSHEQDKQRVFDCFCKKVLKYEARDHYDEIKRQRKKEVSFSELSEHELEQLSTIRTIVTIPKASVESPTCDFTSSLCMTALTSLFSRSGTANSRPFS